MEQTITPAKKPIQAIVTLPGDKKITQRALLLASLADGVSEISGMYIDEDIHTLITALYQLGIVIQCDEAEQSCIIAGGNGKFPRKQASLWCGNSEAATRFLIAACSITPGVYYFDGSPALRAKPIAQLFNNLRMQGVQFIPSDMRKLPCTLIAAENMEGGEIVFEGAVINQIVSALLMIAPYAKSPFTFFLPDLHSHSSIDLTCMIMAEFGALVHRAKQNQYMVPVPQKYQARDYNIEPDFSFAMYFCGAAALTGGEITLRYVKRSQSKQATHKFFVLLEKLGCQIFESQDSVTVVGSLSIPGIEISLREFSDTFLVLTALAPFAEAPMRITHLGELKQREWDRLIEMKNELIKRGVNVTTGNNWIEIVPGMPQPGVVRIRNDYRIAMAFGLIGLKVPGITIEYSETTLNVFPSFFSDWQNLIEPSTVKV